MERTTAGRATHHGLLKQIASRKFIATILSPYFLADCIGIIGLLSKSLQRANITYCHAIKQIDAATSAVTKLLTSPGPNTIEIFNSMPEEESSCGYSAYKTQNMKDSLQREINLKTLFTEEPVARLEIAFLMVVCPVSQCLARKNPSHDSNNLDMLCKQFSCLINRNDALMEFTMLEEVMQTATYKFKDAAEYHKAYIHSNRNSMPNLDALASLSISSLQR